jgi:hypothetical protein
MEGYVFTDSKGREGAYQPPDRHGERKQLGETCASGNYMASFPKNEIVINLGECVRSMSRAISAILLASGGHKSDPRATD